jgi:hypothetical protein
VTFRSSSQCCTSAATLTHGSAKASLRKLPSRRCDAAARIDGDNAARLYGEWFHLDALPPGRRSLWATLNSNDHRMLAVDGKPIEASAVIEAAAP